MTTELHNDTLEWAAEWIEGSLKGEPNERVREFGKNMATTLRAAKLPDAAASAAPVVDEDVHDWLTEQCSRLMYGQCSTLSCLRRGGYKPLSDRTADYVSRINLATCEAYEVKQALSVPAAAVPVEQANKDRLRAALENIASQHLRSEIEPIDGEVSGDFEGAYDIMINVARDALAAATAAPVEQSDKEGKD